MIISVGGFIVNLVGIFVFQHGGGGKTSLSLCTMLASKSTVFAPSRILV